MSSASFPIAAAVPAHVVRRSDRDSGCRSTFGPVVDVSASQSRIREDVRPGFL